MKQSFGKKQHKVFKKYAKIQQEPSSWDIQYLNKTKKYSKYIKWIPGLEMVGVGNSIAMNSANKESDIDLYIVTSKHSLWFVRICITIIFQILGVRKTAKKHEGRFCLSFFSTKAGMDFSNFSLKNDIYLYFWIVYMKPIISFNNCYENFLKKNNSWADFTEYTDTIEDNKTHLTSQGNKPTEVPKYVKLINKVLKKIFIKRTLKTYESLGKPFGIIIGNDILKFHNNDIRKQVSKNLFHNKEDA